MRRVLFVTNHVSRDRAGAFAALAERVPLEVVTFGGPRRHGAAAVAHGRRIRERDVAGEVARGGWSAVVSGTAGRVALPAAYLAARRARVPFVHWAALWAWPLTPAHLAARPLMRSVFAHADAVVTYGEHVSRFVGRPDAVIAPQSVDNAFWSTPSGERAREFRVLFVGRDAPEKGLAVLRAAWDGPTDVVTGGRTPEQLRSLYARAHVLVVPSVRTRSFREPWGLVVNEAMNQRTAIIASDEVGAVAGGLVRHERNGLVVPAGDPRALRAAIVRLRDDAPLRDRLAAQGCQDVAAYSHAAWAGGFAAALGRVGAC